MRAAHAARLRSLGLLAPCARLAHLYAARRVVLAEAERDVSPAQRGDLAAAKPALQGEQYDDLGLSALDAGRRG